MATRFTTSDGIQLATHHFTPTAPTAAGPTVVLHHGFAASAQSNWVAPGIVDALRAAGRTVIAIDARGHGESDKPHESSRYGEERMALDIAELLDNEGLSEIDLVGYSMGGIVALIAGTFERRIRRLVIGGIGAGVIEVGGVDRRRLDTAALAAGLRAEDGASIDNPVVRQFRRFAESQGADLLALAAQAESAHRNSIPTQQITARALVLVGADDPLAVRPEVLAAAVNGARLEIVPGDHLGAVATPEFATAIVRFLA